MTTHIFVRHGILSKEDNMRGLVKALRNLGPEPDFRYHNQTYDWKEAVLPWGIALANQVKEAVQGDPRAERVILIGHSQGGLVCRVAAAALCCPDGLKEGVTNEPYIDDRYRSTAMNMLGKLGDASDVAAKLKGVIMLATPNTGAFTFGQLSMTAKLVQSSARLLGAAGSVVNLGDLTTDRLFRILQHVKVSKVQYLSISGSMVNRFSTLSYSDLADVPLLRRLGIRLALPNDSVVEDESTDIAKAVLPPEIENIANQYRHVRWYMDCSQVSHVGIHANAHVHQLVLDCTRRWIHDAGS